MAEIYPAMNLEDALRSEAKNALQLWLNLEYMAGHQILNIGGGSAPDWAKSDWPHPTEVYYEEWDGAGPMRYVRLTNIKAKEITGIEWEREDVHDRVVDVAYEAHYNVPAGQEQDFEYDFEFDAITTREHATSLALEDALKERLGGISHPVGLENTSKVTAAVNDKYGQTNEYKQRFAEKSVLHGPIDVILRGQRARARVSQSTKCIPVFEYELYLGLRQGGPGHRYYQEVHFNSKQEFNEFIQGQGSNESGVMYQYTALVSKEQLKTVEYAPLARKHRQNASITNHRVPIVFSEPFDDQIQQGVIWVDRKTGEEIDPFNYHPKDNVSGILDVIPAPSPSHVGGFIDDAIDDILHPTHDEE